MADDRQDTTSRPSDDTARLEPQSPAARAREPWATPRVVAFEKFDRTQGPPDGFPMEGTDFYGPS